MDTKQRIDISVCFEKPNPSQTRVWAPPADPPKAPGLNCSREVDSVVAARVTVEWIEDARAAYCSLFAI